MAVTTKKVTEKAQKLAKMARFWPKTRYNGRVTAREIFFQQCLWVTKFCAKFVCQYPQIFHSFTVYVKGASPNVTSLTALNFLLRQLQQSVLIFSRWLVSFLMMIYFQLSRTYCFVLHPQRHVYVQRRQRCFSSFLFQKKTSSRVLRTSKRNIT